MGVVNFVGEVVWDLCVLELVVLFVVVCVVVEVGVGDYYMVSLELIVVWLEVLFGNCDGFECVWCLIEVCG